MLYYCSLNFHSNIYVNGKNEYERQFAIKSRLSAKEVTHKLIGIITSDFKYKDTIEKDMYLHEDFNEEDQSYRYYNRYTDRGEALDVNMFIIPISMINL